MRLVSSVLGPGRPGQDALGGGVSGHPDAAGTTGAGG